MRVLITGGSGVLGRALSPFLIDADHAITAPGSQELDLFDPAAVSAAVAGHDVIFHLATRIPPPDRAGNADAWEENDKLRTVATRVLVDAASAISTSAFILPSVTFLYPPEQPADENTPLPDEVSPRLRSMLDAEAAVQDFTAQGRRGIVLRLGLLWGPGTGNDTPVDRYGSTLHADDAGAALALALDAPAGVYNAVADGERVSNARFKATTGWTPRH